MSNVVVAQNAVDNRSAFCAELFVYNISQSLEPDEIRIYCSAVNDWRNVQNSLDMVVGISMLWASLLGVAGTVCMCATFWQRATCGPSYLYYKAISVLELIHMAVMLEYAVIRMLHFAPSSAMSVWNQAFAYGWSFGDWVKLSVATLTVVISVERLLAIWTPMLFSAIDRRLAAYLSIGASTALGGVYMFTLILYVMASSDPNGYSGDFQVTFAKTQNAIGYIKIAVCLLLAPTTVLVLVGLRTKSKRLSTMTGNNQKSRENWDATKRLCYLQLILAVSTLCDHLAWFAYRMLALITDETNLDIGSYHQLQLAFRYRRYTDCVEVVQVLTGELLHCGKFYLYMLLHKSFRHTFLHMVRQNKRFAHMFPGVGQLLLLPHV